MLSVVLSRELSRIHNCIVRPYSINIASVAIIHGMSPTFKLLQTFQTQNLLEIELVSVDGARTHGPGFRWRKMSLPGGNIRGGGTNSCLACSNCINVSNKMLSTQSKFTFKRLRGYECVS